MAEVIVSENLFDADYVRAQTDLPSLVRSDDGRYLRQSKVEADGKEDVFHFWDEASGGLVETPGSQESRTRDLRLGNVRPALAGTFSARIAGGTTVSVRPLLAGLAENLEAYTPEKAAQVTGILPEVTRRDARGTTVEVERA